jgi:type III pantothenate kinase
VVVNAGTALTIDALATDGHYGVFVGGLIVPGIRLMQQSLAHGTAGIAELPGSFSDFPVSTGNAVYSGVLLAAAGAIKAMFANLQYRENEPPRCILNGGDAALLADVLASDAEVAKHVVIADNLVLQGLLLMEKGAVE